MIYNLYFITITISLFIFIFLIIRSWKHRNVAGVKAFFFQNLIGAWGALSELLSAISPSGDIALFWFKLRYFTLAFLPMAWFLFAYSYTKSKKIEGWVLALMAVIPTITQFLVWLDPIEGFWLEREVGFIRQGIFMIADVSQRKAGPWFVIHSLYGYLSLLVGGFMMIRLSIRTMKPYRMQGTLIFSGMMILLIGALVPTLKLMPSLKINPASQSLALCALLFFIAIFRYGFLDIVPVAREKVIESMELGMMVLNSGNRIIDINKAMIELIVSAYASREIAPPKNLIGMKRMQAERLFRLKVSLPCD